MNINKNKLLLAVILAISLTVTTGVLAWDRLAAVWGDYGPMGTRCLAGVCANVEGGKLVDHDHWVGFEQPCGGLGAWVELVDQGDGDYTAFTYGEVYYKSGGQKIRDSFSTATIYV